MRITRRTMVRVLRALPLAVVAAFALLRAAKTAAAFSGGDIGTTGVIVHDGDALG